ncbi:MAG: hypothetical protein R3324_00420 [Halobacteriales archaeon]|nr:hypothetical protein [Halobacteriales archaeon]
MSERRDDEGDDSEPLTSDSLTGERGEEHESVEAHFEAGECPWCDGDYQNVKAHASQAHTDEWNEWKASDSEDGEA